MNRLYRSPTDRIISGVAGGVAEALRADPALVRIGWVILVPLTGGLMLLLYIVMAVVVPVRSKGEPVGEAEDPDRGAGPAGNASVVIGIFLIAIGVYFFVRQYLPPIDWGRIWPLVLIVLGAVVLIGALRRTR